MSSTARPRQDAKAPPTEAESVAAEVERIPKEISAECGALGSIILDPEVIGPVMTILKNPEMFFKEENRVIFDTMLGMFDKNEPIDAITVHRKLFKLRLLDQAGGIEHITELARSVPTSAHAEYYAALIFEAWMKRRLITAATQTLRDCYDSPDNSKVILDRAETRVFEIALNQPSGTGSGKLGDDMYDVGEEMFNRKAGVISGLPSGFIELDNMTAGFQKGDMIVLAARPSVGKTALAMDILSHLAINFRKPVGFLSMEMNRHTICQRLLCSRASVDSQKLRRGYMNVEDKRRIAQAVGDLSDIPFYIDDAASLTATEARAKIRRMVRDHGVEIVGVDYLQLMTAGRKCENRQQEVTLISAGIKALTRELGIPIIVLSQLNRSSETENRMPRSSDLRESGSLEQDADVVMLLHREAVARRGDEVWRAMAIDSGKINAATLILSKQRNGPTGCISLTFLEECTRFENYNPGV